MTEIDQDNKENITNIIYHPERYRNLKELTFALCAANNKTIDALAKELGYSGGNSLNSIFTREHHAVYELAERLWRINPLGLPQEGKDGAQAEDALFSKTPGKKHWTPERLEQHRLEVIAAVRLTHHEGKELPHFSVVLNNLFPPHLFERGAVVDSIPIKRQKNIFAGWAKASPEEMKQLLRTAHVPENALPLLITLPTRHQRKQTLLSQRLTDIMNRNDIGQRQLELVTRNLLIDPDGEGVSQGNISHYRSGDLTPSRHTILKLAKAISFILDKAVPLMPAQVNPQVCDLLDAARYTPEELYMKSDEILRRAKTDQDELFEVLTAMRMAPDINRSRRVINAIIGIDEDSSKRWEYGQFPKGDKAREIARQMLAAFAHIRQESYSPSDHERLEELVDHSVHRRDARHKTGFERIKEEGSRTRSIFRDTSGREK